MELEDVRKLPLPDQMTFLRGRILEAALSMEVVMRYVHVLLHGGREFEAALDTPFQFSTIVAQCKELIPSADGLSASSKQLSIEAITTAGTLYERRNRFVHDIMRQDLVDERRFERSKVTRHRDEKGKPLPDPEPVTAEEMIDLVFRFIMCTWRLRGILRSIRGTSSGRSPFLTHQFVPQWNGDVVPATQG